MDNSTVALIIFVACLVGTVIAWLISDIVKARITKANIAKVQEDFAREKYDREQAIIDQKFHDDMQATESLLAECKHSTAVKKICNSIDQHPNQWRIVNKEFIWLDGQRPISLQLCRCDWECVDDRFTRDELEFINKSIARHHNWSDENRKAALIKDVEELL